jgi:hypothetical protein
MQQNPYQTQPVYHNYKPAEVEVKPTFKLAWGLLWRQFLIMIIPYMVLLVIAIALQ